MLKVQYSLISSVKGGIINVQSMLIFVGRPEMKIKLCENKKDILPVKNCSNLW